jgi:hypothetical protein
MKPSEALKLVRYKIMQNRGIFICHHLNDLGTPSAQKALEHIDDLLFPYATYRAWLKNHDAERYEKYVRTPGASIEARLCWIDDMIEYWESKGE